MEPSVVSSSLGLLLTDVQGSTAWWQSDPAAMNLAMARHHVLVAEAVARYAGRLPVDQGEGDARFAVFPTASAALAAAVDLQLAQIGESWPEPVSIRVRIGVHAGEVIERAGNLFGETVNRCARIRGLGHGGQVLVSGTAALLVGHRLPDGVTLVDLGEHRMKDLTRVEQIFQVSHAELPKQFPPLVSLNRATHNLPVQLSSFVGRQRDITDLRQLVLEHQLVTVTGFGGMGKTRLALQVGAELAEGDGDGVWFVDLSQVEEVARVAETTAQVLGVPLSGPDLLESLVSWLADKQTLLILDNLEQLLPEVSWVVGRLATAGPKVRVLATSREALHLRGERPYALEALGLPERDAETGSLVGSDAVALFLARAEAADPRFRVDGTTAPAIASICAYLDGWPLAIELAAARVKLLGVSGLLGRLVERTGGATGKTRDGPDRQQTLQATIEWSVSLLTADERTLLERLSVFVGGATVDAIESVCGLNLGEDPLSCLESLVEKSFVRTLDAAAGPRFGLLVPIREYAATHLAVDAAGEEVLRGRHADHYRNAVEQLVAYQLVGVHAIGVVRIELDNIRHALQHLRGAERDVDELYLLSGITDVLWAVGGQRELLELGDRFTRRTLPPSEALFAVFEVAAVAAEGHFGDFGPAHLYLDRAQTVAEDLDDPDLRALVRVHRSRLMLQAGDLGDATAALDAAAVLLDHGPVPQRRLRVFDTSSIAFNVDHGMWDCALFRGDWVVAVAAADRMVRNADARCDDLDRGQACLSLALAQACAGEFASALFWVEEGMEIALHNAMSGIHAELLCERAALRFRAGALDDALADVEQAKSLGLEGIRDRYRALAVATEARILLARGRPETARQAAARAVDLAAGASAAAARIYATIIGVAAAGAAGDLDGARASLLAALETCRQPQFGTGIAACLRELARLLILEGSTKAGVQLLSAAEGLEQLPGHYLLRQLAEDWLDVLETARTAMKVEEFEDARRVGAGLSIDECMSVAGGLG